MYKQYKIEELKHRINTMGISPLDVLTVGVTGAGKSSTINALFGQNVTPIGDGPDPETMCISNHLLNNYFRIWDCPGLGDSATKDEEHSRKIIDTMCKTYNYANSKFGFIDLVLVIIEGGGRDMGTTYKLINELIVPNIQKDRILVAVNQADMAMKGRHWDYCNNKPHEPLKSFLDEKVSSIRNRVKETTCVEILKPIYYSAKYGYNVTQLYDFIIKNIPRCKRELIY